ncbi:hypothetical protein HMY34_01975 [Thiothrix subterranea]|uniref:hypothetical protein n=1 Tax=Thiothrix subterranea TaxID=2735563 RepID=UPI00192CDE46|nr:hypothetical protein [Thiothrix subterranea]QQZ27615.1 hypothetical protein HMY34_01975 [Thiothrix subterranea]
MKNDTSKPPKMGNLDASAILADLAAIHAIVSNHITCMNALKLGNHCNALIGVLTLLELLAAGIDEGAQS